jgi:predicted ABC-type transport system involved in lysophospholipase L1 biosynthesis ATPase subunit
MLALSASRGTAFVIVTHDVGLAARAGRVFELSEGLLRPSSGSGSGAGGAEPR